MYDHKISSRYLYTAFAQLVVALFNMAIINKVFFGEPVNQFFFFVWMMDILVILISIAQVVIIMETIVREAIKEYRS